MSQFRIGYGTDSHRFKHLFQKQLKQNMGFSIVIGGVEVASHSILEANSDGDVVLHALCNALSLAIGKGDLSRYADKMCKDQGIKDSSKYLEFAYNEVLQEGFMLGNSTIMIECLFPKINPIVESMKQKIIDVLNACHLQKKISQKVSLSQIGIGATTGEGLTEFGKGSGIYCSCAVLLQSLK